MIKVEVVVGSEEETYYAETRDTTQEGLDKLDGLYALLASGRSVTSSSYIDSNKFKVTVKT